MSKKKVVPKRRKKTLRTCVWCGLIGIKGNPLIDDPARGVYMHKGCAEAKVLASAKPTLEAFKELKVQNNPVLKAFREDNPEPVTQPSAKVPTCEVVALLQEFWHKQHMLSPEERQHVIQGLQTYVPPKPEKVIMVQTVDSKGRTQRYHAKLSDSGSFLVKDPTYGDWLPLSHFWPLFTPTSLRALADLKEGKDGVDEATKPFTQAELDYLEDKLGCRVPGQVTQAQWKEVEDYARRFGYAQNTQLIAKAKAKGYYKSP